MSLGLAILVLGLLYLLIVSPRFRRVAAILLGILVVTALLFVVWYYHEEAESQRKREAAKTYIKINEIELVDPRVSFSSYDGSPQRLTGRIRNNSAHALESIEVHLLFQDCSKENKCETVEDKNEEIRASVPPGQSRDFDEFISGSHLSAKGRITWSYQVLSVSAHVD